MRIVIFTDANNATATALVRATLRVVDRRADLELAGFVTSRPEALRSTRVADARRWARRVAVVAFDPGTRGELTVRNRMDLGRLARARGVPLLVPPPPGLNDPAFVARLVDTLRPDAALSYFCTRIWKAPLLEAIPTAVNFHDGRLPDYRGCGATAFSIFEDAGESGFTFHHMIAGIDEGPILVDGAVAIGDRGLTAVERAKAAAAVAVVPEVIDRMTMRDPGRPQTGSGSYFSRADLRAAMQVPDPGALTADELVHRIRAFGWVYVTLDGARWPVTRVRAGRHGRFTFRTADGAWMRVDRVLGLPVRLAHPLPTR